MSCNYADGLSPYDNKGVLGVPEKFDSSEEVERKSVLLAEWITKARHVVVHTGAGISTAAGIPDFRGPNGVWTLERKGLKPNVNISFDEAIPTKTHMAIKKLVDEGYVHYVISQNIDGLHLKTGLFRKHLGELHGNMFVDQCNTCDRQFIRPSATATVGQKISSVNCLREQLSGRACRGKLCDTILDWEDNLPENDLKLAQLHSSVADLNICLGTTLQIVPSGNLPLSSKKFGGKLVIINLQPTKHDKKADLKINTYVDDVVVKVMKRLGLEIPAYSESVDPTKKNNSELQANKKLIEWTILKSHVKEAQKLYDLYCKRRRKRKLDKFGFKDEEEEKKYCVKDEKKNDIIVIE